MTDTRTERILEYVLANDVQCKALSVEMAYLLCSTNMSEREAIYKLRVKSDAQKIPREVSDFIIKQGKIAALWEITGYGLNRLMLEVIIRTTITRLNNVLSFIWAFIKSIFTGKGTFHFEDDLSIEFETSEGTNKSLSMKLSDFMVFDELEIPE